MRCREAASRAECQQRAEASKIIPAQNIQTPRTAPQMTARACRQPESASRPLRLPLRASESASERPPKLPRAVSDDYATTLREAVSMRVRSYARCSLYAAYSRRTIALRKEVTVSCLF